VRAAVVVAEQEIAVAVQEIHRHPGITDTAQGGGDIACQRRIVIIANPGFKQVAQNVQCVGPVRLLQQELPEQGGDVRAFSIQMQVGDEQGRWLLHALIVRATR